MCSLTSTCDTHLFCAQVLYISSILSRFSSISFVVPFMQRPHDCAVFVYRAKMATGFLHLREDVPSNRFRWRISDTLETPWRSLERDVVASASTISPPRLPRTPLDNAPYISVAVLMLAPSILPGNNQKNDGKTCRRSR